MTAVKVIEIIGSSTESWEAAAETASRNAEQIVEDLEGMEGTSWTPNVDETGITE